MTTTVACKMTVNLSERAYAALLERASTEGSNKTTIVNRALIMYCDMMREQDRGHHIAVITPGRRGGGDKIQTWRWG